MKISVFDYQSFAAYLRAALSSRGIRRGGQARLAEYLRCKPSFISQALAGKVSLSLEHAIQVAEFLDLTEDQRRYFLLLAQKDRAGSISLRNHFATQIEEVLAKRLKISERI